jgi:hypothetical protein
VTLTLEDRLWLLQLAKATAATVCYVVVICCRGDVRGMQQILADKQRNELNTFQV